MAIKSYANKAAYDAAVKPTIESQVSMLENTRQILTNGVNVITQEPVIGDVVMLNEGNNITFLKGGSWIQKANIPSAWQHVGYVYFREGQDVGVVHKDGADLKYADVVQFELAAPTLDGASHTATIGVRVAGGTSAGYGANTNISYTYSATTLADVCAALNDAIDAAQSSIKFTNVLWAYLANANNEKVTENATKIIVQLDNWNDYRQYSCSGMTHITWGDMPASDVYFKNDGTWTNYWGVMNRARTRVWATSNGRVPSTMEPIKRAGNDAPVRPSCFEDATDAAYQYCADIREYYGTYDNYLHYGYGVKWPQKYGTFALPDPVELSAKYALLMAPTKSGGTKAKFPAMYNCATKSFNTPELALGKWHMHGSAEGSRLLTDETVDILAPSISKMGTTAINNSTHRWFIERYNVYNARNFYGNYGFLYSNYVHNAIRAQAVALLKL